VFIEDGLIHKIEPFKKQKKYKNHFLING